LRDRTLDADAAVLAVGNLPPHDPPGLDPDKLSTRALQGRSLGPERARELSDPIPC
jgi:hypothetical protein